MEVLNIVWKQKEEESYTDAKRIQRKIDTIRRSIVNQVEDATDPSNASIKQEILGLITTKKKELEGLEHELGSLDGLLKRTTRSS